jgi:hypothetical protein
MAYISLVDAIALIHEKFAEATALDIKADNARIEAGRMLIELRARIEAGEVGLVGWWHWYSANFTRSRRDAEKCMALAQAKDPSAALEHERQRAREGMREYRAAANVSRTQARKVELNIGGRKIEVVKTEFVRRSGADLVMERTVRSIMAAADQAVAGIEMVSKMAKGNPSLPQATVDYVVEGMLTAAKRAREVADEVRRDKRSHIQLVPTHEGPETEN